MLMKCFDTLLYDRDANVHGVTAYIALALRCAAINWKVTDSILFSLSNLPGDQPAHVQLAMTACLLRATDRETDERHGDFKAAHTIPRR